MFDNMILDYKVQGPNVDDHYYFTVAFDPRDYANFLRLKAPHGMNDFEKKAWMDGAKEAITALWRNESLDSMEENDDAFIEFMKGEYRDEAHEEASDTFDGEFELL